MKPSKIILPLVALMALQASSAKAQFLERLKDRAVEAAQNNIENRVHNKTNEVIDDALDGNKRDKGSKGNKGSRGSDAQEEVDQPSDYDGNSDIAPAPKKQDKKALATEYAKSDFVPGDECFFWDDFEREQIGEFASQWDLLGGTAEMAVVNGKKAFYLNEEGAEVEPLMTNQSAYLPDVFTLEFDFFVGDGSKIDEQDHKLRAEYRVMLPEVGHISVEPSEEDGIGHIDWILAKPAEGGVDGSAQITNTPVRDWSHFALSFNKRALKVYINGVRVVNLPNVKAPKRFTIEHSGWWDHNGYYITNVKLCKGAVPLYDRLTSEGKIVSYGISFESGKADLKPESMTEIARIAKLMQENADLKFEVQGHCDNQGSDAINDPLSHKRAEAIVAALVGQGIQSSRLTAVGKGSHVPIADNSTDEGRAKNRRVEFVKK